MTPIWQVRLFNGPILLNAFGMETRRFRSHKVGALLAYLSLNLGRPCPREELYEALWPEEDAQLVANRFRVTLNSLRQHLEPEGVTFGAVLDVSVPRRVRLRAETVACDTMECERLLRAGRNEQAAELVTGPLLPGYYEEWALTQQAHYALLADDFPLLRNAPPSSQGTKQLSREEEPLSVIKESRADQAKQPKIKELMEEGSAAAQTALPSSSPPSPSLPLYLTRFFGRERELQILQELLHAHRQVSLIGMGGMGKTRLAVEIAGQWEGERYFISFASLPDAGRLYDTILQALNVAPQTDTPTDEQLIRILNRHGAILLVIDNAEHLSEAVAAMSLRLLTEVPKLRLLITSRQRLDIAGETVLLLTPLDAPGAPAQTERLLEFASVSLFVDRAKNARPDFRFSERHIPAVIEICKRLEGIPLALELAAARITSQTPLQIARALQTTLTDLKSHQHGLSQRHQSLRAVIQGSLDLLSEPQRAFFFALSAFQGGWSVEAAKAVTGCEDTEEYLDHLTISSLIVAREDERLETMRYMLLETLRQFAAERLSLEEQQKYQERHARFYIAMVAQADQENFRFMDRLEADHENLLLAMAWYWKHDRDTLLPLLTDLLNLWANRGQHRLALEWIALAFPEGELIAVVQKTGRLVGFRVYVDVGRYEEAQNVAQAALQAAKNPIHIAWALAGIGYVHMMRREWDQALACQLQAMEYAYSTDAQRGGTVLRMCCNHAAQALNGRGQYAAGNSDALRDFCEAEAYLLQGLGNMKEDNRLLAGHYLEIMCSLWGQQREKEGDQAFDRALRIGLAHRHLTTLIRVMEEGAFRLAAKNCPGESIQFASAAEALREKMGYRAAPYIEERIRELLLSLRTLLGIEAFDRHWQSGFYTPLEVLIPSVISQVLLIKTN